MGGYLVLNFAIVGCGLIGRKRALALQKVANLTTCYDFDPGKATKFSQDFNCTISKTYENLLSTENLDAVIIAIHHNKLSELSRKAILANLNVLIEKPGALNYSEFLKTIETFNLRKNLKIHIGYNHMYHPSIIKSLELVRSGAIGRLMFIRGSYGHGGRLGYENEWRANKLISGGGELIDQGSHLLDLSIAFLGDLELEYASTPTYFWNMQVEDNVFLVLKNKNNVISFLHASCTEWKNSFSFEIYGENGKIKISGLGGSYGVEKLTFYKMNSNMGVPESESWEYDSEDSSWKIELLDFIADIEQRTSETNNIESASKVLRIIEDIYQRNGR
jgi:predicted dehydrogenase